MNVGRYGSSENAANVCRSNILERRPSLLTSITPWACTSISGQDGDECGNLCARCISRHVLLLIFRKEYKKRLIQSSHSLVVLLPVEIENSEGMRGEVVGWPRESVYGNSACPVLEAQESI